MVLRVGDIKRIKKGRFRGTKLRFTDKRVIVTKGKKRRLAPHKYFTTTRFKKKGLEVLEKVR